MTMAILHYRGKSSPAEENPSLPGEINTYAQAKISILTSYNEKQTEATDTTEI